MQVNKYVVHRQKRDGSFEEIDRFSLFDDAVDTYDRYTSALIVNNHQEIVMQKNLRHVMALAG